MKRALVLLSLAPVAIATAVAGTISWPSQDRPCITGFGRGFSAGPTHLTLGPDGNLWINEGQSDLIAKFDVRRKEVTAEYPVPKGTQLHDLIEGPDGSLWFTGGRDFIGKLDPKSGKIMTYPGVVGGGQPHLWWASPKDLYFAEVAAGRLARFDPATGNITASRYNLPPNSGIHSFAELPDGTTWWGLQNTHQLAHFDAEKRTFDKFVDLPDGSGPHWLVHVPADRAIWIAFAYSNDLGRYDLDSGELKILDTPLDPVSPERFKTRAFFPTLTQMVADRQGEALWFATLAGLKILRLDLATHEITEVTCGLALGGVTITIESDRDGNLWVTETAARRLGRIDR